MVVELFVFVVILSDILIKLPQVSLILSQDAGNPYKIVTDGNIIIIDPLIIPKIDRHRNLILQRDIGVESYQKEAIIFDDILSEVPVHLVAVLAYAEY